MDEGVKETLKQINRRLINAESSVRVIEQRIDVIESTIKAIEKKVGRNTQDLSELSNSREDIERLRDAIIKLSADVEGLAKKSDVDALRKYLDLVAPVKEG